MDNLRAATDAAARGKRGKADVAAFLARGDAALEGLRQELRGGSYRPGAFRQFRIYEPKPRTISCAPFRDRVVHHAVCDVAMPLVESRFIADSYACRKGKGSHRAAARAQELARRSRYYLKLDVRHFFDSIDHGILLEELAKLFRESRLNELLERIVRAPLPDGVAGKGVPIGNLTSQWFANLYLDRMDHLVKEAWGAEGYVRYMDDAVIFASGKDTLWRMHGFIETHMREERHLTLKAEATRLAPCAEGIPFLGLRVFPGCWRLQRARFLRTRRRHLDLERGVHKGNVPVEKLVAGTRAAAGILGWFGFKGVLPQGVEA